MAEPESINGVKENKLWKGVFAVSGIMSTLVIYGVLQVCLVFKIQFLENFLPFLLLYIYFLKFLCGDLFSLCNFVGEDNESSLWSEQGVF